MTKFELPLQRVINRRFEERGISGVVRIEAFSLQEEGKLRLVFESTNSSREQGIWMTTQGALIIEGNSYTTSIELWEQTAPKEVIIGYRSTSRCLLLYNSWQKDGRRSSQGISSGMLIEEIPNGRRYRCNDLGFETDFDKLIFRIEHVV